MAQIADFSLPPWLAQSNTDLIPNALAKGAAAGANIAQAIQGARQMRMAQARLQLIQAEEARQAAEEARKAKLEAMRFKGYENFARDREILRASGNLTEEQINTQALLKNLPLIAAGDPDMLGRTVNQTADNTKDLEIVGLRKTALDQARERAENTLKLGQEKLDLGYQNLELRGKALEDTDKFRREKLAKDEELELEKEAGRNKREYDKSTSAKQLEELKQKGRLELLKEKNTTSKVIAERLSDNDRMAMAAELREANDLQSDEAVPKIDAINAKYDAKRRGVKPVDKGIGAVVGFPDEFRASTRKSADGLPTPSTKAEFDALPSGAWFINPKDGKRMRKK